MSVLHLTSRLPRPVRWLLWGILLVAVLGASPARADELTRQVQEELRKRNLYFGDVDGRRTEQVAAALRRYQQRKGFASTGEADETTLRSLTLLPPAPSVAASSAPPAAGPDSSATPPVLMAATFPWPDTPVLRSDVARRNPTPPDTAPTDARPQPAPTVAPPPAAASLHWPGSDVVHGFVASYLRAGQSDDTEAQMPFYADQVDYFNEGRVDRRFIRADIDGYDRRWPERHFTLLDPITLAASPDHDPEKIVVNFHYRFVVKRPHDAPEGEMMNTYTLQRTGPESLRIVAMKESRVRGK